MIRGARSGVSSNGGSAGRCSGGVTRNDGGAGCDSGGAGGVGRCGGSAGHDDGGVEAADGAEKVKTATVKGSDILMLEAALGVPTFFDPAHYASSTHVLGNPSMKRFILGD
ncbi:hypothetical protein U1Q18_030752 [Sarracenia purpurea var. burkii]